MITYFTVYTIATTAFQIFLAMICEFQFTWSWINPYVIYENVRVNRFGCLVLTILAHLVAGPVFVSFYWFYKLCTVGRDKEDERKENHIC